MKGNIRFDILLQALAVLLLHYCSGLQDCAEQIERERTFETTSRNSSSSNEGLTLKDESIVDSLDITLHAEEGATSSSSSERQDIIDTETVLANGDQVK